MGKSSGEFSALKVAVLTVTDSRDVSSDSSGDYLSDVIVGAGHMLAQRALIADDRYQIRAVVSGWIASADIQVVIVNGGTGFYSKNSTPEALMPLFDREIKGFGEIYRTISWQEIGSATLQSLALAGMANQTLIFAVPGSTSACCTAWEGIIQEQLDARTRPCNFVSHVKKI